MAIQILPEIFISPPPPSEYLAEPFSPFDNVRFTVEDDENNYRPALLSPPPTMPTSMPRHLSPLSPPDAPVNGQGLERERFERLLKTSRERSAALGNKKSPDLRKELAMKAYNSKQSTSSRFMTPLILCTTLTLCSFRSGTSCALLTQSGGTALPICRLRTQDATGFASDFQLLPSFARSRFSLDNVRVFGGGVCHLKAMDRAS